MALTGYPAGSPQAPQTGLAGGALLAPSSQQLAYPSMDGAGRAAQANPGLFQNLMNMLGGIPGMKYAPGIAVTAGQIGQGDVGGAIGAGVGTAVGGKLAGAALQRMAGAIPAAGPGALLAKAGMYGVGTLLGSSIGAQLGKGVGAAGNQLFGGAQAAVGDAARTVAGVQREAGQSAGTGVEAGVASDKALAQRLALMQAAGVNIPRQYLEQNYQILQKYKDADVGRQMQLNQQNAVLTGQLNQQIMAGQLAAGAQQQAGATTRDILTSNPYAASVLQTGGVRGI